MRFTLTIDLGNEAMHSGWDVASALDDVSARIMSDHGARGDLEGQMGSVRDDNGNTVGSWEVRA